MSVTAIRHQLYDPRASLDGLERLARSLGCLVPPAFYDDKKRRRILVHAIDRALQEETPPAGAPSVRAEERGRWGSTRYK